MLSIVINYLLHGANNWGKSFLEQKLEFPPPGKIPKFHFLAKTVPPQAKKNFVSPPSQIISEISIPPQKFGVKSHYATLELISTLSQQTTSYTQTRASKSKYTRETI